MCAQIIYVGGEYFYGCILIIAKSSAPPLQLYITHFSYFITAKHG